MRGSVNVPGAFGWERIEAEKALETRIASAERGLAGLTPSDVGAVATTEKGKPGGVATLDAAGKVPAAQLPASMPASDVAAWAKQPTKPAYTAGEVGAKASTWSAFYAGTSAPSDTTQLWVDTTANTGGLKYWNGSAWVAVPVAYT